MFILYTSPLGDLCRSHGLNYQLFADDQKIYRSFKPGTTGTQSQCISHFEACIEDTRSWMNTNLLNDEKMESIILGTRQQLAKVNEISIKVGNAVVKPVPNVRDLGFFLDCLLKNGFHINKISGQLYPLLHNIYKILPHIDMDTTKIIIQTFVVSKLDYCYSLVVGTAGYQLDKLQCIQNMACRVITN